jgi:hypothetical protein
LVLIAQSRRLELDLHLTHDGVPLALRIESIRRVVSAPAACTSADAAPCAPRHRATPYAWSFASRELDVDQVAGRAKRERGPGTRSARVASREPAPGAR